jgi:hypothetical protein
VSLLPFRRRSVGAAPPFSRVAPTRMAPYSCRKLRGELEGMPKSRSWMPAIAVDFPASLSPNTMWMSGVLAGRATDASVKWP